MKKFLKYGAIGSALLVAGFYGVLYVFWKNDQLMRFEEDFHI